MAATLARGTTVITNAAREPEIEDLCHCLIAMGARIDGMGTTRLSVGGVKALHGAEHAVMADRIEAGTFAIAAAIAGGDVELVGARRETIAALLERLERAGAETRDTPRGIGLRMNGSRPVSVDLSTAPFPGFPTDLQAQFMALMTVAKGTSTIRETIFENRFQHAPELARMGADIRVEGGSAQIHGPTPLAGAGVMATDLRASACLVLAGVAAEGETVVDRIYHLERGYEGMELKLQSLGARVARWSTSPAS